MILVVRESADRLFLYVLLSVCGHGRKEENGGERAVGVPPEVTVFDSHVGGA